MKTVLLAALLAAFSGIALSQPPAPSPSEPTKQQPANADQSNASASKPRVVTSYSHLNESKSPNQSEDKKNDTSKDWWASLLAFVTLVVIAIQAGIYFRQAKIMEETLRETKRGNDISLEGLQKLQRAFVGLKTVSWLSHVSLSDQKVFWTLHFIWENSGATRTEGLRLSVAMHLDDNPIPDGYDLSPQGERPVWTIAPKSNIGSQEIQISGSDLAAVQVGKKSLYFWGRADYRDVFTDTPDHVTEFFFRVVGIRGDPTKVWNQSSNVVELVSENQTRHNRAT